MITLGCDVGSIFSKAVVLDGDELAASRIMRTTGAVEREIQGLLDQLISEAGLSRNSIDCLGATGNGADLVKSADFVEDTLNCAGAAAVYYLPQVRFTIDIGGQSITSMLLNENGEVMNFMRNDKCASGSGRFLEVMSNKLKLEMKNIDDAAARSKKVVEISSQCGVFAESEVITHLNSGESTSDIIAGVCGSVAAMAAAQARRFGVSDHYTVTGGVARIKTVTEIMRGKLEGQYHSFPFDPQLAAAIGAALLGDSE